MLGTTYQKVEWEQNTYTEEHKRATADPLNNKNGNKGGKQIFCTVASGKELGVVVTRQTDLSVQRGGL